MTAAGRVQTWIDERLNLEESLSPLREKTVPVHRHSSWYFLGGLTLFLFGVQFCSRAFCFCCTTTRAPVRPMKACRPSPTACSSGWLICSLHSWSANLMVFCAFAHMFSVALARAYRKPRELTWISGVIVLGLVLGFGFSGYLLPWNTRAYFATKVGTEVTGQVPVKIGRAIMIFMRGGEDVWVQP